MNSKTNRSKSRRSRIIGLVLILVLVLSLSAVGVWAKYQQEVIVANKVSFISRLADAFTMTDQGETENSIELIPGTIPDANPVITVTGKSEVPAYLYLEVTGLANTPSVISADWILLDGVTGANGGSVYVYGSSALTDDPQEDYEISILSAEALSKYPQYASTLNLWAYLVQKKGDATAQDSFAAQVLKETTSGNTERYVEVDVSCAFAENDYTIKNTGDIPALIRARVVLNWIDEDGNVTIGEPLPDWTAGDDWQEIGGTYYYKGVVAKNASTSPLTSIELPEQSDSGKKLQVIVLTEAIQAEPSAAAGEAWGITYSSSGNSWN